MNRFLEKVLITKSAEPGMCRESQTSCKHGVAFGKAWSMLRIDRQWTAEHPPATKSPEN
jgi:hypothetical protein